MKTDKVYKYVEPRLEVIKISFDTHLAANSPIIQDEWADAKDSKFEEEFSMDLKKTVPWGEEEE